jgi:hypothetical protein
MRNLNTSDDFIRYAKNNGLKKYQAKRLLDLLKEFTSASIASNKDFLIRWVVKFQIESTVTTLKPGKTFKKVKAYPAINILKLSRKKW